MFCFVVRSLGSAFHDSGSCKRCCFYPRNRPRVAQVLFLPGFRVHNHLGRQVSEWVRVRILPLRAREAEEEKQKEQEEEGPLCKSRRGRTACRHTWRLVSTWRSTTRPMLLHTCGNLSTAIRCYPSFVGARLGLTSLGQHRHPMHPTHPYPCHSHKLCHPNIPSTWMDR